MKKEFPIFKKIKKFVYLDSAATNLKPRQVIKSINEYYKKFSLNNHSNTDSEIHKEIDNNIKKTKELIARKINGEENEIHFMPSTTYSLNILSLSLEKEIKGEGVVTTKLEHSSNMYPWERITKKISFFELDENYSINLKKVAEKINKKTKLVSIFHENNTTGSINNVEKIAEIIKKKNKKCIIVVDACQSISWLKIDVKKWNIDFLVFSGHKIFGPTGIGLLWAKNNTNIEEILFGGGKKRNPRLLINGGGEEEESKFEVGTLPLAQIFGLKESLLFINKFKDTKILESIEKLKNYTIKKMKDIRSILIYNKNCGKNILFNIENIHAHDIASYLGRSNIFIRAGNFCCPYLEEIIKYPSALRISFSIYNTKKDVDSLIYQIKKIIKNPEITIEHLIK